MEGAFFVLIICALAVVFGLGYDKLRGHMYDSAQKPDYSQFKAYYSVPMSADTLYATLRVPFAGITFMTVGDLSTDFNRETGILRMETKFGRRVCMEYHLKVDDMGSYSVVSVTPLLLTTGSFGVGPAEKFLIKYLQAQKINNRDMRPYQ